MGTGVRFGRVRQGAACRSIRAIRRASFAADPRAARRAVEAEFFWGERAIVCAVKFRTLLLPHHDDHCIERISSALDRMDAANRLWTVLSIEPAEQTKIWELFADHTLDADHFAPSSLDPLKPVIHHGKNTLPMHNFFQKRFCRADDESGDLWGYNHQSLSWATGPGYFVAHPADTEGKDQPSSYLVDYTRLPKKKPSDWPEIIPNEAKLGRFVYAGMKDYMRKVSDHVSIGRAYRGSKAMDAWFILCREDPAEG